MSSIDRRSFIQGLITAPFVVKSGVLMPLRGLVMPTFMRIKGDPFFGIVATINSKEWYHIGAAVPIKWLEIPVTKYYPLGKLSTDLLEEIK